MIELVICGTIRPCRAADHGCGADNYAVYPASRGFDVTGIDMSPAAQRSQRKMPGNGGCRFVTTDLLGDLSEAEGTFGFACDRALLQHIFPKIANAL